jgi:hypothetical protein
MSEDFLNVFETFAKESFLRKDYLLFLRIPKNASSSISEHLGDYNLLKKHERTLQQSLSKKIYKGIFSATHARPHEIKSVISSIELKAFSFAVVRNPWDRAVSMYHFAKKMGLGNAFDLRNDLSFEDFCQILESKRFDSTFIPTFNQVEWTHSCIQLNEILRFENLAEDFSQMIKNNSIGGISPDLPHINKTNHTKYQDYYSSETKKIIHSVFEEDCDTFKYIF